jgi:two-component system response regulator RegA
MSESVLLIDDDDIFVRVLARALAARGFEVRTAGNRADALVAAREQEPDHAVLDLKLGEENGLALIPELLEIQPDLRILLLTGYASIATAVEAIKRGATDYLAKPVDADQVVQALRGGGEGAEHASTPSFAAPPL